MGDSRMKVLMTTDTVGGVWTYSVELCRALIEHGVEVHLAAMGAWPSKAQQEEASRLPNVILYKSDYKLEWMQDPWEDVEKAHKWITSIYQTIHPDLVHFNNYAHIENFWSCPVVTVFHSCVQTWWQAVKGTEAPASWSRYTGIVKDSLNASDVVVSPTESLLKNAIRIHDISSHTEVIHNGRDINFSEDREKENIILCMGRIWDEAKNLKALSGIAKNLPWPVYIAGSNVNPGTGEKVEIENVHFLGELSSEEAKNLMERAAIFASPTKYEPFGLAILEAAKAGCALALSNIDTLIELWGTTAAFFNPENPEETEKKILELIEDEEHRNRMVQKSREKSKDYNLEKMGAEYASLYKRLIVSRKTDLNRLSPSL
ncbi:glycosyltransferase family 4 protein [Zunongwangia sp. F363]|uniref:Glycosyltransferase family 4 protein n=1 Tax=Autumnicola tepida TaxID=3075595 RepID=A0ABU3CCB5_9FLAO|nr:glycosyltransferase family 4 protein [Zunongwangia sp. F363]MDT0643918.1 glycosyltransferase family 4 protein [Zunongwangia sp. F363]